MGSQDLMGIVTRLEQMLLKLADGTIDPGDVEFIDEQLERVREYLSQGLDGIIGEQQENIAMALAIISSIKVILMIQAMQGK